MRDGKQTGNSELAVSLHLLDLSVTLGDEKLSIFIKHLEQHLAIQTASLSSDTKLTIMASAFSSSYMTPPPTIPFLKVAYISSTPPWEIFDALLLLQTFTDAEKRRDVGMIDIERRNQLVRDICCFLAWVGQVQMSFWFIKHVDKDIDSEKAIEIFV